MLAGIFIRWDVSWVISSDVCSRMWPWRALTHFETLEVDFADFPQSFAKPLDMNCNHRRALSNYVANLSCLGFGCITFYPPPQRIVWPPGTIRYHRDCNGYVQEVTCVPQDKTRTLFSFNTAWLGQLYSGHVNRRNIWRTEGWKPSWALECIGSKRHEVIVSEVKRTAIPAAENVSPDRTDDVNGISVKPEHLRALRTAVLQRRRVSEAERKRLRHFPKGTAISKE